MSGLSCERCGSASFVRNGRAHGRQRCRREAGGRGFTATPPRGQPPARQAPAVLPHALGNVSQAMIAQPLGVSPVAVRKRVRAATPAAAPSSGIVPIDGRRRCGEGQKPGLAPAGL